jgi:hypothetical protein
MADATPTTTATPPTTITTTTTTTSNASTLVDGIPTTAPCGGEVTVTDLPKSFVDTVLWMFDFFAERFPDCTHTKTAIDTFQTTVVRNRQVVTTLMTFWHCKMDKYAAVGQAADPHHNKKVIEALASISYLDSMQLVEKYNSIGERCKVELFAAIADANVAARLYVTTSGDDGVAELTECAQRLALMFRKEDLRSKGTADKIMELLPQIMTDERLRDIIIRIAADDERINGLFTIMEIHQKKPLGEMTRTMLKFALRGYAGLAGNSATQQLMQTAASALPELGRNVSALVAQATPFLGNAMGTFNALLASITGSGNPASSAPPTMAELSAAADELDDLDLED